MLSMLGVGGRLLDLICSYLSQRKQRVLVEGASSPHVDVISRVPQGSVFGPCCF